MKDAKKNNKLAQAIEFCSDCDGYNYELMGCCSGHACGCAGQPVDAKPCGKCNSDGKKEPSLQAQKDWPWFFLTREEFYALSSAESAASELELLINPQPQP